MPIGGGSEHAPCDPPPVTPARTPPLTTAPRPSTHCTTPTRACSWVPPPAAARPSLPSWQCCAASRRTRGKRRALGLGGSGVYVACARIGGTGALGGGATARRHTPTLAHARVLPPPPTHIAHSGHLHCAAQSAGARAYERLGHGLLRQAGQAAGGADGRLHAGWARAQGWCMGRERETTHGVGWSRRAARPRSRHPQRPSPRACPPPCWCCCRQATAAGRRRHRVHAREVGRHLPLLAEPRVRSQGVWAGRQELSTSLLTSTPRTPRPPGLPPPACPPPPLQPRSPLRTPPTHSLRSARWGCWCWTRSTCWARIGGPPWRSSSRACATSPLRCAAPAV